MSLRDWFRTPSPGPAAGWPIGSLFLVAFLVRMAGVGLDLAFVPGYLEAADTSGAYYPIAGSLTAGDGYRLNGSAEDASRIAPVLPLWLAALMAVAGADPPLWVVGTFNAAFRAGGVVCLYLVARRYFGHPAARWATVLYVIDPWETFWVGFVLKESLAVPLVLLSVWLLARLHHQPSAGRAWAAGLTIGLATLTRFPDLVLWPVAGYLLLRVARPFAPERWGRLRRAGGLFLHLTLATLLVLSPWLVRNWAVVGQPVLSPHFAGRKFYTSYGPGIEMERDGYYAPRGIDHTMLAEADREQAPWEREGSLFRRTLGHIASNPGELAERLGARVVNTWRPTFAGASARNWVVLGIPYCFLLAVSLIGIVRVVWRRIPCPALAATTVALVGMHLVFWGEIRNRQYVMPLLYAFGGVALARPVRPEPPPG
jgi:hypothetical protein